MRTARPHVRAVAALLTLLAALAGLVAGAGPASAQPTTWNFTVADVPYAAPLGNLGQGVTVAVLDTWIDQSHPEFGGRVLDGADCKSGSCVADSGSSAAEDGCEPHGTHVAGIIASADYGVAPKATILPVRVLAESGGECEATPQAVASGITYAMNAGAKVINISLGGDSGTAATAAEAPIVNAANQAAAAGDLVVFAAGNSGNGTAASSFGNALTVGAVGPSGRLASYSETGATLLGAGGDTGSSVDCSGDANAASDCVESTWYCSTPVSGCDPHGLAYDEGTSMAAPQVAGLGALLFAQNPSRSLADVEHAIESTTHATSGSTYGLIDVCHAMLVDAAAGSTCGAGANKATTSSGSAPAVARKFVGCPKTVTVKRGARPQVKCKITPKQGGVVIAVQVFKGKTFVTTSKIKTAKDGSLRAIGPAYKSSGKLRLDVGKTSVTITVKVK